VPVGAGLSSSAALCVGVAFALAALFRLPIDAKRLALSARRAESEFTGVEVGIMDQFASALGVRDHALLIDCRTAAARPIPLEFERRGIAVVVADSATPRALAASAYNQRVAECREAAAVAAGLWPERGVETLRDVRPADLPRLQEALAPTVFLRARHVVTENERVLAFIEALTTGDVVELGALMRASHRSLRDDFEVSTPELDLLVELASAAAGVIGARLTGAGFGGCTVNLVQRDRLPAFAQVIQRYREQTGRNGTMLVCEAADGAGVELD
jgi:galactokinase